ncbi:MAG: glycosyltransferase family 39 protein [Bauldia sp.]
MTFVSLVVLGFVAAHLLAAAFANLVPDEAYYWLWSRHLSASYYDHPPMVAWWMRLSTALFGDTALGLRTLSVVSLVPASAALYLTGIALFDRAVAARAVIFFNATLLIGVGGLLATPDPPSVLFWSLATLAFALLVRTQHPGWWLVVGACAGLGVLSKLTNLFLGLGLVLALFYDSGMRRWLRTPWPWLGALVALADVVPMLLWNQGHDWVTFTKQLGRMGVETFKPQYLGVFALALFLLLNPFVAVFAGRAIASWFKSAGSWRRPVGLLAATILPLLAYMAVHALRTKVSSNWPAPAYPTLALIAAVSAQSLNAVAPRLLLTRLRVLALPFGAAVSALVLVVLALPADLVPEKTGALRLSRGWPELAEAARDLANQSGAAWIATDDYSITGELAYYLRDSDMPVVQVTDRVRYAFAPPPDPALLEKPALLVVRGSKPKNIGANCFARRQPQGLLSRSGELFSAFLVEGVAARAFAAGCGGGKSGATDHQEGRLAGSRAASL